jgi:hypothetical protein
MNAFTQLYNSFKKLNINAISQAVISNSTVKDWLIETAQNRIIESGEVGTGEHLETNNAARGEVYSFQTIQSKAEAGKTFRNVTLEDTGTFYNSWAIDAKKTFYEVEAEFNKTDGNIYENFSDSFSSSKSFESAVLSLTDEEMNKFVKTIFLPRFLQTLKNEIRRG